MKTLRVLSLAALAPLAAVSISNQAVAQSSVFTSPFGVLPGNSPPLSVVTSPPDFPVSSPTPSPAPYPQEISPPPLPSPTPSPSPSFGQKCIWPAGQDPSQFTLTFDEEFNGDALNKSVWSDYLSHKAPGPPDNYSVDGGTLKIWPGDFQNLTIDTDAKFTQLYGYFEMEAKLPIGKGAWPGFWLESNLENNQRSQIDIMVAYSGAPVSTGWSDANFHPIRYTTGTHQPESESFQPPYSYVDLSSGFHKYAMKWEPGRVTYYFDGSPLAFVYVDISKRMYVALHLWFGSYSGQPTDKETPRGRDNSYEINYIRTWQLGGPACQGNLGPVYSH